MDGDCSNRRENDTRRNIAESSRNTIQKSIGFRVTLDESAKRLFDRSNDRHAIGARHLFTVLGFIQTKSMKRRSRRFPARSPAGERFALDEDCEAR